jgi:hypothetical protein
LILFACGGKVENTSSESKKKKVIVENPWYTGYSSGWVDVKLQVRVRSLDTQNYGTAIYSAVNANFTPSRENFYEKFTVEVDIPVSGGFELSADIHATKCHQEANCSSGMGMAHYQKTLNYNTSSSNKYDGKDIYVGNLGKYSFECCSK